MTNTISPPLHALILLFVWSVLTARWLLLRYRLYDVRLTHSLTFACVALTLKDPTVASVVIPEIGAPLTRTLVHILILLAIAALIGVYNAWDRFESGWRQPLLYAIAGSIGVALIVLSAPARQLDVPVEHEGGWQPVAYFALYASLTVYGLGTIGIDYLRSWRSTKSWRERFTVGGVVVFFASMLAEAASMLVSASLTAAGTGERFNEAKQNSNGWFFAVMMVVAVALSSITLFRPQARRSVRDQYLVRRLWNELKGANPGMVLGSSRDRISFTETQHGYRIASEIYEIAQKLDRYGEPVTDGRWDTQLEAAGLDPSQRAAVYKAAQLQIAIARKKAKLGKLDTVHEAAPAPADVDEMLMVVTEVARQWQRARHLQAASVPA
ncbi:DUF6545 domain-containing protein [Prescottella agglutinans]|uniref:DUF6545 domain-containing protein n=1 Tax=Prescottella agglutinans TaxID=1644129 RepID=A0ABT6MKW0_9NOCA|nr:DUF6545 domain-containing protein [Prescottella agglutinans]MDH6283974.1 hypothetical protein [Prescottella agglutinans]